MGRRAQRRSLRQAAARRCRTSQRRGRNRTRRAGHGDQPRRHGEHPRPSRPLLRALEGKVSGRDLAPARNLRRRTRLMAGPAVATNPFRLDGKVALVTGAGRGLGRGIALALAGAGAELLLNSRSPAELDRVAAEIAAAGGTARTLPFDVTDAAALRAAFAGLARDFGRLDILVNNAGVNRPLPFLEIDEATLDRLLDLNVRALFRTAQAGARLMVERAPQGVRVVSIAPTFIETPLTTPFFADPKFHKWVLDRIPLGRLGTIDEVAQAVVFLASPAAGLVTGSSLLVDGGGGGEE